jgi:hypothetical protein
MLRKLVLLALVAALVSGCGNKTAITTVAETEGTYVDVGGLTYQVQLSRYLNPFDVEDKEYLHGLPAGTNPVLPGGEIWFGVWMRVKNYSGGPLTPTDTFTIVDTENAKYQPVPLDSPSNPFAYQPILLQQSQVLPLPDTAASSGPIQGSLILFRLKTGSIQNRPLTLEIEQPGTTTGVVDLDL